MSTMTKNQRKYAIMRVVEMAYTTSRLPDGAFAKDVSADLGFEVKRASITQARMDLGIPNNGPVRAESEVNKLKDLLREVSKELFFDDDLTLRIRNALGEAK